MSDDADGGDRDRSDESSRTSRSTEAHGPNEAVEEDSALDSEDPFAELETPEGSDVPPEELDDLFEPVETTELDEEAVWEAVLSTDDEDESIEAETGVDAIVPKNQYCKRCEFFSEPPEVACTNPGTEIEELVGVDEFRVTNCPVVARRGQARDVFDEE